MAKSTLIFDFFGVISTEVSPRWFGKRFTEAEAKALKEKYMSLADLGKVSETELFAYLSQISGEPREYIYNEFMSYVKINRELVDLILKLKKKYKIVLLSNALDTWLKRILVENDLYKCFDHIVISAEEGIAKPLEDIYRIALSRSDSLPSEAIFIDDNIKNTTAAERIGIASVVYKNNEALIAEFDKKGIKI